MAAEPVIVEHTIAPILERIAPDLKLVPSYYPTADPPIHFPGLTNESMWSDVFDWAKKGYEYIFHGGAEVDILTRADMEQAIDAAVGQVIKSLSGYIDMSAALTVQAAMLLEEAIDNAHSGQLHDFRELSERIDRVQAGQDFMAEYVVPNLAAKTEHAVAQAYAFSLAAQENAQDWGVHHIFAPLYESLLKVQPAINAKAAEVESKMPSLAEQAMRAINPVLHPELGVALAPLRAAAQEVDECLKPMCNTMGPKTDLGKLLRGLKTAEYLALIAALAAMSRGDVDNLIRSIGHMGDGLLDQLAPFLVGGEGTLGGALT